MSLTATRRAVVPTMGLALAFGAGPVWTQEPPSSPPRYEVDANWPQLPLGDGWITGGLGGMCVDGRDHVFLLNRQNVVPADLNAASLAPPIIELDPEGRVVQAWGDPEQLGGRLHDCHGDADGTLWIVAAATGHIQQYSNDGELLRQVGETGVYDSSDGTREGRPLNSDRAQFFLPASLDIDEETGEIYVADGELPGGNQRIAVLDPTGRFLRQWSLHRSADDSGVAALPHCLRVSRDGLVYVCDRQADRIQVFDRQGTFVRNIDVPWPAGALPPEERGATRGTAVVVAFSPDPEQRWLFVVNQNSVRVEVLDRATGERVSSFGGGPGRYPSQFTLPHGIGVDSRGNVYVAEQEGRRIQRFSPVPPLAEDPGDAEDHKRGGIHESSRQSSPPARGPDPGGPCARVHRHHRAGARPVGG